MLEVLFILKFVQNLVLVINLRWFGWTLLMLVVLSSIFTNSRITMLVVRSSIVTSSRLTMLVVLSSIFTSSRLTMLVVLSSIVTSSRLTMLVVLSSIVTNSRLTMLVVLSSTVTSSRLTMLVVLSSIVTSSYCRDRVHNTCIRKIMISYPYGPSLANPYSIIFTAIQNFDAPSLSDYKSARTRTVMFCLLIRINYLICKCKTLMYQI